MQLTQLKYLSWSIVWEVQWIFYITSFNTCKLIIKSNDDVLTYTCEHDKIIQSELKVDIFFNKLKVDIFEKKIKFL